MAQPIPVLLGQAMELHQQGRLAEAAALYQEILRLDSGHCDALHLLGLLKHQQGNHAEALRMIAAALEIDSSFPEALMHYANVLCALKRNQEALEYYDRALALRPDDVPAMTNRGAVLAALGRPAEALAHYDRALALNPYYTEAHYNRGNALKTLMRPQEALACYDWVLDTHPGHPDATINRGMALAALNKFDEALASYDKLLAANPNHADALVNRGNALVKLRHVEQALGCYERALAVRPDDAATYYNRGNALFDLKRYEQALASHDKALTLNPRFADALNGRCSVLRELHRDDEALASVEAALTIAPDSADALYNRANVLKDSKRHEQAVAAYEKAVAVAPDHPGAGELATALVAMCDWEKNRKLVADAIPKIRQGECPIAPFTFLGCSDDPSLQWQCAKNHIGKILPAAAAALSKGKDRRPGKIRLAYLSADLHHHATAFLMAELFERHDRARFEVRGISFGFDDGSDMRRRLVAGFDQFHDVRTKGDYEVATLLRDLQIDIAVDLKGYTFDSRPGILAFRPAPIQVNYLGYPGTMGAGFIDYVIADRIVLPFDQQPFYTEKIVQLPDCYQVNDRQRKISERIPTRREAGLPETGFVFCCFNNNYKITAAVFDVWMRLLTKVPGSVLWLLPANAAAENNLRREAQARGVDPARLVFAARLNLDEHLARHRLADLFLDTLPYNAHTTASDALWAGLPIVTCQGQSFAARVAGSLLHAVGLKELVTDTLADYEALATRLAVDPPFLAEIRRKLERRKESPLFDTDRFRAHIEAAYTRMWETWQRGEPPQSFAVEAAPPPAA